jgi:hypothetical protein
MAESEEEAAAAADGEAAEQLMMAVGQALAGIAALMLEEWTGVLIQQADKAGTVRQIQVPNIKRQAAEVEVDEAEMGREVNLAQAVQVG